MTKWLLYSLCLLHLLLDTCNGCNAPNFPKFGSHASTESSPISVCAFCLDNSAGVRWMVHKSNSYRSFFDPKRIDTISIELQCRSPDGSVINHDDCFDGYRLPYVASVSTGEWRWYFLEQNLSEGTQCSFITTLRNVFYFLTWKLETSTCIVERPRNKANITNVFPAVCSGEPGDSVCSCSCPSGFSGGVGQAGGLLCKNIDECTSGVHHCKDVKNCMDTEGDHVCLNEANGTTTITPAEVATTTSPTSDPPTTYTTPTDTTPISVHAFCSENQAGVKWMVDESNQNRAPFDQEKIDSITFEFQCHTPEGNVITRDDCFNGFYLSSPLSVQAGEWRWYILEQQLSEGTECNFSATVENSFYSTIQTLNTSSCTVKKYSKPPPTPAVCSGEPGDSICSCSCRDGFSGEVNQRRGLLCKKDCVDTEGHYECSSESATRDPTSASTSGTNAAIVSVTSETTVTNAGATSIASTTTTTVPSSGRVPSTT